MPSMVLYWNTDGSEIPSKQPPGIYQTLKNHGKYLPYQLVISDFFNRTSDMLALHKDNLPLGPQQPMKNEGFKPPIYGL